jgi:Spy/CpxP family protein refolding chaperone
MGQPGVGGMNNGGRGGIPPSAGSGRGAVPNGGPSLQMGPVGRWWDDKGNARALALRPEQKKRMDAIFNANRGELTERFQALREEESRLEAATRDTQLSQESVFTQMDRVAQARDALEKVNTRLMQNLRQELDAEQAARLQSLK